MSDDRPWTFLTSHGHVLLAVWREPDARAVDIAASAGLTPRATFSVLHDLEEAGYVTRQRVGRRTSYEVHAGLPLRHDTSAGHDVADLLTLAPALGTPAG